MIARCLIRLSALGVLAYLALPLLVILGASFTATPYLAFRRRDGRWTGIAPCWPNPATRRLSPPAPCWRWPPPRRRCCLRCPPPWRWRATNSRKAALSSVLMSPLVLPHIVLGAALLQYGAYFGLTRSFLSLLIGHVVIIAPSCCAPRWAC